MTQYLTIDTVLQIHDELIEEFGGSAGVRDMALLESAILRPQSGYYDDVIAEAAALLESLSQNHPFVDGNKRTSILATETFLRMNGWVMVNEAGAPIEGGFDEGIAFIVESHRRGEMNFDRIEAWLRQRTQAK